MTGKANLRRSLNLPLLTLYGLGTIIGAGIYVVIGKVAGVAGMQTPFSFLIASVVAGLTAFSYAELSSRFPKSAGEAVYVQQGFGLSKLAAITGLAVIIMGVVSSATLANGFYGYLREFIDIPRWTVITLSIVTLGAIAAWGIKQSVVVATTLTLIEMVGLLMILWVGKDYLPTLPEHLPEMWPVSGYIAWEGMFLGAFLSFYAFIGFEDMVNVAEEVKNPQKNLPMAILLALMISSLMYILVATVCILIVEPIALAGADAPLSLVYRQATGQDAAVISLIGLLSALNGMLIQLIMASRILYGMGEQQLIPRVFAGVNIHTRTPVFSNNIVTLLVLMLALSFPLITLAKTTSFFTLAVFTMVNLSLLMVKRREPAPEGVWKIPFVIPLLGAIACLGFILLQSFS